MKRKKTRSLPVFELKKNVLDASLERINHLFDLFDTPAVMFSGGKDSTVVLNLALQVARERKRLPLRVIHYDEEAIPYQVEEYVRRVAQEPDIALEWYCVPLKHRNACSSEEPYWYTWWPADRDRWVRPLPPEALTEIPGYSPEKEVFSIPELNPFLADPQRYGKTCFVMGIRADESMTRRRAVINRESENYIIEVSAGNGWGSAKFTTNNIFKAYPIYDWRTPDVWRAPAEFGWDYCQAYDEMEMAGISHSSQRLAPPFGEQPSKGLWKFKLCWPELWERMVDRVPGAATAARYAMTELYSFGTREKPDDMTPQDWLVGEINRHEDSEMRAGIRKRIDDEIRCHFRETADPIAVYTAHPNTGLSWSKLVEIAARGDVKKRVQPSTKKIPKSQIEKREKAFAKYWAEIRGELDTSEEGTRF